MRLINKIQLAGLLAFNWSIVSASAAESKDMKVSNKEKVVQLLKSIETGDAGPIAYINPNKYIQHNLAVGDGLAGFGEVMKALPEGSAKANTVRVFEDGDYVFAHTEYNFFGPKVGFDIFRFEDGLIVEHWDNLQAIVEKTASGRSQIDGATEITDLEKTEGNKELVKSLVQDVFIDGKMEKAAEYISSEEYLQHNPLVADGLEGLSQAMKAMAESGEAMVVEKLHFVLGEGNFALSVSEGQVQGKPTAYYDLFRIENGKIVEHWDAIEAIPDKSEWKNENGKFGFPE
ncbi:MAG: nuclear transport factor 2 family protein [Verrucomicrobiota bacterium]